MRDLELACHLNVLVAGLDGAGVVPALETLAEAGYGAVVLPPLDPGALGARERGELRAAFADHALTPIPIAGQTPDADVSSGDDGVRGRGRDALRAMLALTEALGGDQLNGVPYGCFGPPPGPTPAEAVARAAREVGALADEAAARGITMTFEVLNRYETSAITTAEQAIAFVAESGSRALRIHLDTFHMAIEEADPVGAARAAAPLLGYLELGQSGRGPLGRSATGAGAGADVAGDTGAGVPPPAGLGGGSAPVREVLVAALAAGYRGRIGVEAFSRAVLAPGASELLAIWREPYLDGRALACDAAASIRELLGAVRDAPQPGYGDAGSGDARLTPPHAAPNSPSPIEPPSLAPGGTAQMPVPT